MACTLRTAPRLLLTGFAFLLAAHAHAADNSATAAAALKVLTQARHEASASAPATGSHETVTLQRSETLDMLVRRQYPGWPLKDEVLRRALADLNPKVIPNAANNMLKRGSIVVLPNTEDLRRTLLQHYPAMGELVRVKVEQEVVEGGSHALQGGTAPQGGAEKRRWVRFP